MNPEVITMGRVSVDLYPEQIEATLAEVETFAKSLGGSATNVAVAAARLGHPSALITKAGDDGFGEYVRSALREFGVDTTWVSTDPELRTPLAFCEIHPPDDFPILFYREPKAPDMNLTVEDLDFDAISAVPLFWITGTGLSDEPSRTATLAALERRSSGITVFDLDFRPTLWNSEEEAGHCYREALRKATVAVGNQTEVAVAVGTEGPTRGFPGSPRDGPRPRDSQAGTGRRARPHERGRRRISTDTGRRPERSWRRRRLRRSDVPSASLRMGRLDDHRLRQRRWRHRRLAAGVRRRYAHPRRGAEAAEGVQGCLRSRA